jgi:hypothetical protein
MTTKPDKPYSPDRVETKPFFVAGGDHCEKPMSEIWCASMNQRQPPHKSRPSSRARGEVISAH